MERSKSFSGYYTPYEEARFGFENRSKSYSFNGPSSCSKEDGLYGTNPELKRRKRVAAYNMYTTEEEIKLLPVKRPANWF
ncbi:hypothetical protein FEM48_Zijuj08G0178800 [Ziziphus jujuba var. spinosa]|uniref:Uncharacterized protein n=1 Tax=Ziziphus jujuba var. spinosa TaxID=714518 RepID=A0A978V0I6_ZIZJJ|nr:hypothetical protein FEM48_Zijuj08G0178800 [Ziziphus jujuba var. spinosa]